jgi:hypothetical protein
MKSRIVLGLLFFWLFALLTPSVVTIIDKYPSTFVFNLNEEEQKETVTFDSDLKHFTRQSQFCILQSTRTAKRSNAYYLLTLPIPHREISVPPPEQVG